MHTYLYMKLAHNLILTTHKRNFRMSSKSTFNCQNQMIDLAFFNPPTDFFTEKDRKLT